MMSHVLALRIKMENLFQSFLNLLLRIYSSFFDENISQNVTQSILEVAALETYTGCFLNASCNLGG